MNIFIIGGTAESIEIIKFIKSKYNDLRIITSTTTSYGSKIAKEAGSDIVIAKPLPKEDILNVLNDIYKVKKMSYDKLTKKQELLKEQISSYNEENIDISDLYDRLESK